MDSEVSEVAGLDTWAAPLDPSIFGLSAEAPAARSAEAGESGDLVVVDDVDLSFGGVRALCGVSLTVRKGDIHAIIGPNGAGKSSLLNVIGGIYRPDRGRVSIAGQVFARVPTQRLAKLGVARTFQNLALFKGLSVRNNVITGRVAAARATFLENIFGWVGRAERRARLAPGRTSSSTFSISARSAIASRVRCPMACRNASSSHAHWSRSHGCCCSTSRWQG